MQSSNTKKIIVSAVVVILMIVFLYFLFLKPAPQKASVDEFGNPIESEVVGKDLVNLLAELQSVSLSTALFDSPGFVHLTDFTTEFSNEPKGRSNPFQAL